jgi:hypothetical protein
MFHSVKLSTHAELALMLYCNDGGYLGAGKSEKGAIHEGPDLHKFLHVP